jgi:hypothetical protein
MPEMHVILTAAYRDRTQLTYTGTVIPRSGATRAEILRDVLAKLANSHGHGDDVAGYMPIFFALEPNQLSGT